MNEIRFIVVVGTFLWGLYFIIKLAVVAAIEENGRRVVDAIENSGRDVVDAIAELLPPSQGGRNEAGSHQRYPRPPRHCPDRRCLNSRWRYLLRGRYLVTAK